MYKAVAFLFLAACLAVLPACGGSDSDSGRSLSLRQGDDGFRGLAGLRNPAMAGDSAAYRGGATIAGPVSLPASFPAPVSFGMPGVVPDLELAGFSSPAAPTGGIPSLASLALEVESVPGAALQVQAIAESLGGFLVRLSGSGGAVNPRSDLLIRVPQAQFTPALERIEALGEVQSRSLGSEDVTERHLDLTARLAIYGKEEQRLLSLLERTDSVPELLSVERELSRVRTNIERAQGQLALLERRVALATIHVALFPGGALGGNAPSASFALAVANVSERVAELRRYVAGRGGVIDEVYLASFADEERAEVTFRVFARDFDAAIRFIEDQGQVEARELLERASAAAQGAAGSQRPDAGFTVAYADRSTPINLWIPALIIVLLIALGGLIAYLVRLAYQRGRQRGSFM